MNILWCSQNHYDYFFTGVSPISVSFNQDNNETKTTSFCGVKVCGRNVETQDCGDEVANWLCEVLNLDDVRLVRQIKPRKDRLQKGIFLYFIS